jgi:heat-inducible transcriptional repressor
MFLIQRTVRASEQLSILHKRIILIRMITELNERSRQIFRFIVDSYLETGQPVGSRTISRECGLSLSPASIRNTMADLEEFGLLYAPHTSSGRMPTDHGLRLYIDGLMEMGGISADDRRTIETSCAAKGRPMTEVLDQTTRLLSGLSACASLVIAPKAAHKLKQIQFVPLEARKILVVLVFENGMVENRMMDMPSDIPTHSIIMATNYLNANLGGRTLEETKSLLQSEIQDNKTKLDAITCNLIAKGLDLPFTSSGGHLIIRGQSKLLEDVKAIAELERARILLGYLEEQKNMASLLESIGDAQGVQIFIGAENKVFDQTGWSLILSPYHDSSRRIVGAIGVIGPTRLNYDRIIPMVDYTSQVMSRIIEDW